MRKTTRGLMLDDNVAKLLWHGVIVGIDGAGEYIEDSTWKLA